MQPCCTRALFPRAFSDVHVMDACTFAHVGGALAYLCCWRRHGGRLKAAVHESRAIGRSSHRIGGEEAERRGALHHVGYLGRRSAAVMTLLPSAPLPMMVLFLIEGSLAFPVGVKDGVKKAPRVTGEQRTDGSTGLRRALSCLGCQTTKRRRARRRRGGMGLGISEAKK